MCQLIKVNGKIIRLTVLVFTHEKMVVNIEVIGKIITCMVKDNIFGLMVENILENI